MRLGTMREREREILVGFWVALSLAYFWFFTIYRCCNPFATLYLCIVVLVAISCQLAIDNLIHLISKLYKIRILYRQLCSFKFLIFGTIQFIRLKFKFYYIHLFFNYYQ